MSGKLDHMPLNTFGMLAMMVGSDAIDIEQQVSQKYLKRTDVLPRVIDRYSSDKRGIEALEAAGVEFDWKDMSDKLFVPVKLPPGWQKVHRDHAMYMWLVDENGRRRGDIFYKSAFYDRDAFMTVLTRFDIRQLYLKGYGYLVMEVRDQDKVLYRTRPRKNPTARERPSSEDFRDLDVLRKAAHAEALQWLQARYPGWEDPVNYWDGESLPEKLAPLFSKSMVTQLQKKLKKLKDSLPDLQDKARKLHYIQDPPEERHFRGLGSSYEDPYNKEGIYYYRPRGSAVPDPEAQRRLEEAVREVEDVEMLLKVGSGV